MKKENKKIVGIYHSRDLDGWMCGVLFTRFCKNLRLVPYNYDEVVPDEVFEADIVYIADVSLTESDYQKLHDSGVKVILLDHHQSSIDDFAEWKNKNKWDNFQTFFDVQVSACEIVWKYFRPNQSTPMMLEYVGVADMKSRQDVDLDRFQSKILPYCTYLDYRVRSYDGKFSMSTFDILHGLSFFESKTKGDFMLQIIDERHRAIASISSYEKMIGGLNAICINYPGTDYRIFDSVYDESKHDIMLLYFDTGSHIQCSVYSKKPNIDASLVAKKFGGGGHSYAAGFRVNSIDEVFEKPRYYQLDEIFEMIEEPYHSKTQQYFQLHQAKIALSLGSGHNHQSWTGGYKDHLTEICNIAIVYYDALSRCRKLSFTLSDVLVGLLWHDAEKPFKYAGTDEEKALLELYGSDYQRFIIDQAATVGIVFTDDLLNGLIYVHGEGNAHKKNERVQRPLAAFMHHCDNTSARIWFDQSQCRGEW